MLLIECLLLPAQFMNSFLARRLVMEDAPWLPPQPLEVPICSIGMQCTFSGSKFIVSVVTNCAPLGNHAGGCTKSLPTSMLTEHVCTSSMRQACRLTVMTGVD